MKKLSTLLTGVAVLCIFTLAQAQSQDTALARIDNKSIQKANRPLNESVNLSEERPSEQVEVAPQVKFIVPEAKDRNSNGSILNNKVGPNGEEVLMDRKGYYYFDGTRQKVRVNSNALRDKPKTS